MRRKGQDEDEEKEEEHEDKKEEVGWREEGERH